MVFSAARVYAARKIYWVALLKQLLDGFADAILVYSCHLVSMARHKDNLSTAFLNELCVDPICASYAKRLHREPETQSAFSSSRHL